MANEYYTRSGGPATSGPALSALVRTEFALIQGGFDKLLSFAGNANKMVVINGGGTALASSALGLPAAGTLATLAGLESLTNKRWTWRVVALADAAAITPAGDTSDEVTHVNTQALGTLTVNAPTGAPTEAQRLLMRIKSTNAHGLTFNGIYRASNDLALPAGLSGGGKTDYFGFVWNSADGKWDLAGVYKGFT